MIRLLMTGMVSLSLLVVATSQQKKDTQEPDQKDRANKIGQQSENSDNARPTAEQTQRTELPELFAQLELNDEQKQKLLTIYRDSDQKSQVVWDRVQDLHREAICMEAAAIAAARLEAHDHEGESVQPGKPDAEGKPNPVEPGKRAGDAATTSDLKEKTTPNAGSKEKIEQSKADRNTADKTANTRKADVRQKRAARDADRAEKNSGATGSELDGDLNVVAIRVGIAQPDGRVREYLLTQPGSAGGGDADPAFSTHTSKLTQVWKEIHDGHEELVELEADTIVKVEAQLTEAQLQKLDTTLSQASNTP